MSAADIFSRVQATLESRKAAIAGTSYVASLYAKGTDSICKKIAEEAAETIMAAKDGDPEHVVREVADLLFHSMILLSHQGVGIADVAAELERREGVSGITEKNARGEK